MKCWRNEVPNSYWPLEHEEEAIESDTTTNIIVQQVWAWRLLNSVLLRGVKVILRSLSI